MAVLGGASRTGKGLLALELMKLTHIPYLSLDPLKMALARAVPDYPLNTHASSVEVAEALWPFVSALIVNLDETQVRYIVEGEVLPKHVYELRTKHRLNMVSCFVGYRFISTQHKLDQIRQNAGHPNDWSALLSDDELRALITEGIDYSNYLFGECQQYKLQYIDFSADYDAARQLVLSYLTTQLT